MMILVFLLIMTSLTRVWLKPTLDKSELKTITKEQESRSKRQATFFDLLHQAIEKYANCADEHLAPLKALANYKQYETLTPEKYPPHNQPPIVGAAPNHLSKPNVKCTRVNLCTVTNQNSDSETADNNNPVIVGKALNTHINNSKPNLIPYFSLNGSDKNKLPFQIGNPYGFGNVPPKHSTRYSQHYNPYNQDFFNLFFKKPTAKRPQQMLKATGPDTGTYVVTSCPCLRNNRKQIALNTTEEQVQYANQQEIKQCPCLKTVSNPQLIETTSLETDVVLGSSPNKNAAPSESKEFDENLNQLLMQLDEMAESASNEELRQILDKLKILKSSLDINFVNKEDLSAATTSVPYLVGTQKIHQAAKTFEKTPKPLSFSNFGLNLGLLHKLFNTKSSANDDTTTVKIFNSEKNNLFESQADVKSAFLDLNEDFNGAQVDSVTNSHISELLSKEINTSSFETDDLEDSSELISKDSLEVVTETSDLHLNTINNQNVLSPQRNEKNLAKSHDFPEKDSIVGITGRPALKMKISNSQDFRPRTDEIYTLVSNMENDHFENLNDFIYQDHIEALTRSPVLQSSHRNFPNLAFPNDKPDTFESSLEDYYEDSYFEARTEPPVSPPKVSSKKTEVPLSSKNTRPKQPKTDHIAARVGDNPTVSNPNIHTSLNNEKSLLNKNVYLNSYKPSKKDSKITISITSSGKFKHIKVEQHDPDDKKLEINEKEKINMSTPSSKGRSIDMVGTGSKYIKVVKQPHKKDSYAEPILSEIYPANSKFPTKEPLSIYWHKIENQPLKLQKVPDGVWQTFRSGDVFDNDNSNEKNHTNITKKGIEYDDTPDIKGSDSVLT